MQPEPRARDGQERQQLKSSRVQKMPFGLFKGHRGAALVRKPLPTTFLVFANVDARV